MKGKITSIVNCGTIVQVWLKTRRGETPVNFDWRMYANMRESLGIPSIIGMTGTYKNGVFEVGD